MLLDIVRERKKGKGERRREEEEGRISGSQQTRHPVRQGKVQT
jgi:hypothetical protein